MVFVKEIETDQTNGRVDNININNSDDIQSLIKRRNMKNISKRTGYLVVILFWLTIIMLLSSCGTFKWVEPIGPAHANNHRFSK